MTRMKVEVKELRMIDDQTTNGWIKKRIINWNKKKTGKTASRLHHLIPHEVRVEKFGCAFLHYFGRVHVRAYFLHAMHILLCAALRNFNFKMSFLVSSRCWDFLHKREYIIQIAAQFR